MRVPIDQVTYFHTPTGAEALLQVVRIDDESTARTRTHSIVYRWRFRSSPQSTSIEEGVGEARNSAHTNKASSTGRNHYHEDAEDHDPIIRIGNLGIEWSYNSHDAIWITHRVQGFQVENLKSGRLNEKF
jgi:hypothetical protein